jgi:hypothetical protein
MATTAKVRKIQQIADAGVTNAYTVPTGVTTSIAKIKFTNVNAGINLVLDIYHDDGTSNLLVETIQLPSGIGVSRNYYDLDRSVFAAGDILKIDPDSAAAFNMFIYFSETSQ